MQRLLIVSAAGALGSAARYLLAGWIASRMVTFPLATLTVNVLGSFLVGAIMELAVNTTAISPHLRVALTVGLLGGFTTYSTFNFETLQLLRTGSFLYGFANILATVAGCLAAGLAGVATGRWMAGVP
jgi:fluoride exporter